MWTFHEENVVVNVDSVDNTFIHVSMNAGVIDSTQHNEDNCEANGIIGTLGPFDAITVDCDSSNGASTALQEPVFTIEDFPSLVPIKKASEANNCLINLAASPIASPSNFVDAVFGRCESPLVGVLSDLPVDVENVVNSFDVDAVVVDSLATLVEPLNKKLVDVPVSLISNELLNTRASP
ncbi:hypothetical protein M5K25_015504 [Dendrobium thyrsiflorum]|uniref:Uncharacterized protein n=1 Tax=Dendrobium thyrsiflorum TaxID=117978 RepID=A0ABD0UR22_DENTH